jgi:hypothetical protein
MKIILINGTGGGKTLIGALLMEEYADTQVKAVMKILTYETHKEAAEAIASATGADVLILVGRVTAEFIGCDPWQTIHVSGGRPIFQSKQVQ